ncbi:MAG TPA: cytochrome C oxidase subunit I [Casimicrobiaceae bacterium]|nr:cytochrome C oxidase subunit I [Casimicrobiaceae bacterium]
MADTDPQRPVGTEPAKRAGGRHVVVLIAALSLAPIVAAYVVYYHYPRTPAANYGTLLPTAPAPPISGTRADGSPFRLADLHGRWVLLFGAQAGCGSACDKAAYASRQARTMQGKDQDRVVRALLVAGDAAPPPSLLAQHPDLIIVRVDADLLARLPGGPDALYVIDPLGNLVLRYPEDPDIRGIANDLTRLLKASRIG